MGRPPLFDKDHFRKAATVLREAGPEVATSFLKAEPILGEYLEVVARNAALNIFKGMEGVQEEFPDMADRVSDQIRFCMIKVLMITRECYRDLSIATLEKQMELDFDEQDDTEGV